MGKLSYVTAPLHLLRLLQPLPHEIGYRNLSIPALKKGDFQPRGKHGATEGGPRLFKDPEREENGNKADTWVPDHLHL